ncbi:hypothetical protein CMI37_08645 [Candidatus Pacearchaeota archaeon]|nr:hypothetical protein [Candidatus Pacearchaeota archaeon]
MIERYEDETIRQIWSKKNTYSWWKNIELLYLNNMLNSDYQIAEEMRLDEIAAYEEETRHELVAALKYINNELNESPQAQRKLHYGLTSSDILDTTSSIQIRESIDHILLQKENLDARILYKIDTIYLLKAIGRTHGKHAEEIMYVSRFEHFKKEVDDAFKELELSKDFLYGKMTGPVGTGSEVDTIAAKETLYKLDLIPAPFGTQIIPRHYYIKPIYACCLILTAYERFCTLVRLSAIDEVDELQEGFLYGQTGSSSMPHKNNPVTSENICGLARLVRSNLQLAFENCNLWFERDISHSSVERVMWPDTFHLVAHATKQMTELIRNLRINHLNIKKNLRASLQKGGSSHKELLEEASKSTRFEAYREIQKRYSEEDN